MAELTVEIVSTQDRVYLGPARYVSVPAVGGELGVLPGRQSLLSLLEDGVVRIEGNDGEQLRVEISGGFITVDGDYVTVAADVASQVQTLQTQE